MGVVTGMNLLRGVLVLLRSADERRVEVKVREDAERMREAFIVERGRREGKEGQMNEGGRISSKCNLAT
jgi:hypothetical protein